MDTLYILQIHDCPFSVVSPHYTMASPLSCYIIVLIGLLGEVYGLIPSMIFHPSDPLSSADGTYAKLVTPDDRQPGPDDTISDMTTCFRWNPDYLRKTPTVGYKTLFHYFSTWNDMDDTAVTLGYQGWLWIHGLWAMVEPENIMPGKWNVFCISFDSTAYHLIIALKSA